MINKFYEPIDNPEKIIINDNIDIYIVEPDESINLLYNPEVIDLTDYAIDTQIGSSGSITLTNTEQFVGINSIKAIMYKNDEIHITVHNDLHANQPYTFSFYSKNEALLSIYIVNNSNVRISNITTVKSNEFWSSFTHTFVPLLEYSDTEIVIRCDSLATEIYLDAFQLEPKSYATTFISGNLKCFSECENLNSYTWLGTPNASPSIRLSNTNSGGKLVSISELGFDILGFQGLGLPTFKYLTQELALNNANYYQGYSINTRTFNIVLSLTAQNQKDYFKKRSKLANLLMPSSKQVTRLVVCLKENNEIKSEMYQIDALYTKGLEGQYNNFLSDNIVLEFTMLSPYITSVKDTTHVIVPFEQIEFTFNPSVIDNPVFTNSNRNKSWQEIATSAVDIRFLAINKIITGHDNNIYIIGNARKVSNSKNYLMCKWDGKELTPLMEIVSGVQAYDAVLGNDNNIYIVGDFSAIEFVTTHSLSKLGIIRYDLLNNLTYSLFEANGMIRTVDIKDSTLVFAGTFTQCTDGVDNFTFNYMGKYNTKTHDITALDSTNISLTGNQSINAIKWGKDNKIWFGGNFLYLGADKNILYIDSLLNEIVPIDGVTFSSELNISNCNGNDETVVKCIEITDFNDVYIGGVFNSTNSIETASVEPGSLLRPASIAKWNNTTWEPMQLLMKRVYPNPEVAVVNTIKFNKLTKQLFVGGDIRYSGKRYVDEYYDFVNPFLYEYQSNTNGLTIWTGAAWLPYPFELVETADRTNDNIRGIVSHVEFVGQLHNPIYNSALYNQYAQNISTSDYGLTSTFPDTLLFSLALDQIYEAAPIDVSAFLSKSSVINTKCSALNKPLISFFGPGKLKWLKNSTGQYIHFNAYEIKELENVILNLNKLVPTIYSSFNGNIKYIVNVTSSLNTFQLNKGVNLIESFVYPDDDVAKCYITYKTQLLSIDQIYNKCE